MNEDDRPFTYVQVRMKNGPTSALALLAMVPKGERHGASRRCGGIDHE